MNVLNPNRRMLVIPILVGAAMAIGLAFSGPLKAALTNADEIVFSVLRGGEPLGHHKILFWQDGEDLHVEIDIQLEASLAFITIFRYHHKNHEIWRGGRLVAIDTQTYDDGEDYWLMGRATEAGFEIEGSSGNFIAPTNIMPTSYWNVETVERAQLLDTQSGRLIDVDISPVDVETLNLAGGPITTQRYGMTGDLTLDLWYTADGEWAKITFEARGEEVVYAR